jgi:putative peptide zinc metalloprotease protein
MTAGGPPGSVRAALSVCLDPASPPRLADGLELLGEFKDSGYAQPPSLVRRADGQVIQLTRLLYLVVCRIDGARGPDAIADLVSADLGRSLTADQVGYLIAAKLTPLGIVTVQETVAAPAALPTAAPFLALRARATLLPAKLANAAATSLRPLFHWPVIVAVIAGVAAVDYWLFAVRGLTAAFGQILNDPADLLLVVCLTIVSGAFHECGHAAGCSYGGARPGRIGVGIYLVWPSFFTNVTDSYRLSRAGRLRTDLGGLYFNLIFVLALAGAYVATSAQLLLLVIALTHVEMLEQLLPFVRFDGYFILSDFVGVPDLFARIAPVVRSGLSRGNTDPRVTGLRRNSRIAITAWVLCVIPLLGLTLGYLVLQLPAVDRALWHSVAHAASVTAAEFAAHRYAAGTAAALGLALAALSIAGSLYVLAGLARRVTIASMRWSAGRPARRLGTILIAIAGAAPLALYWITRGQFRDW